MEITKEMLNLAAANANHEQLRVMYDAMKAERDTVAAQVEALRKALLPFASTGLPTLVNGENYSVMHDRVKDWFGVSEFVRAIECFNKTPQQHLAEIRAQAGRDGFFKGVAWILDIDVKDISAMVAEEAAKQYADSIRREK